MEFVRRATSGHVEIQCAGPRVELLHPLVVAETAARGRESRRRKRLGRARARDGLATRSKPSVDTPCSCGHASTRRRGRDEFRAVRQRQRHLCHRVVRALASATLACSPISPTAERPHEQEVARITAGVVGAREVQPGALRRVFGVPRLIAFAERGAVASGGGERDFVEPRLMRRQPTAPMRSTAPAPDAKSAWMCVSVSA